MTLAVAREQAKDGFELQKARLHCIEQGKECQGMLTKGNQPWGCAMNREHDVGGVVF